MLTLSLTGLGAPPSNERLAAGSHAEAEVLLAPWRLAVRLQLQQAWVRHEEGWTALYGRPGLVQPVLAFPTRQRRDRNDYVELVKELLGELTQDHWRKVGGTSRAHAAPRIRQPRAYALWPDLSAEWIAIRRPKLVHGDTSELLIRVRRPDDPVEPVPEPDGTTQTVP